MALARVKEPDVSTGIIFCYSPQPCLDNRARFVREPYLRQVCSHRTDSHPRSIYLHTVYGIDSKERVPEPRWRFTRTLCLACFAEATEIALCPVAPLTLILTVTD